jgi:high mobility group protein B1
MSINQVNNLVKSFLTEHATPEILSKWESQKIQESLKKTFSKGKKKSNAPKRNKTAYIYYCDAERKRITQEIENGNLDKNDYNYSNIMKHCGDQWSKLKISSPSEIEKYQILSDNDKQRYQKELESYIPEDGEVSTKSKRKKNSNGIKSSKSAYMFYSEDNRQKVKDEMKDLNNKQIVAELGKRWTALKETPQKTKKYFDLAAKDKLRYEKEKASLVLNKDVVVKDDTVDDEIVDESVDEEVEVVKKTQNKPKIDTSKKPAVKKQAVSKKK